MAFRASLAAKYELPHVRRDRMLSMRLVPATALPGVAASLAPQQAAAVSSIRVSGDSQVTAPPDLTLTVEVAPAAR